MGEAEGREGHAEAEPDLLGDLAQRPEQDLRRRTMGSALTKVVFDGPDRVESQGIRELDLVDRLVVRALLALALAVGMRLVPGLRRIDFVEQIEFQAVTPGSSERIREASRPASVDDETLSRHASERDPRRGS